MNKRLKDVMNKREAADYLGIDARTLTKYMEMYNIPYKVLRTRFYIDKKDLDKFIEKNLIK